MYEVWESSTPTPDKCAALSVICHNRKGHNGSQCLFKTVATLTQEVEAGPVEEAFLGKPSTVLYGPARQPLEVLGQFSGRLVHSHLENIFVVRDLHDSNHRSPSHPEGPEGLHWTWNPWRGLHHQIKGRCMSVCSLHTLESTLLSTKSSSR